MAANVRARVFIKGRVQGVFFRMETQKAANRYGVFGWVRNKAEGTVEAVFEGEKPQVEAMVEWCREGPPQAYVTDVDVTWEDYRGEFSGFDIRY